MPLTFEEKRAFGETLIEGLNARDFDAIAAMPQFDEGTSCRRSR